VDGPKPDSDDVGGEMYRVIKYGTSKLTETDLNDVITYLQELRPVHHILVK
jgi:hypothetical protein